MHRALAERVFHHPIERVFARYSDHESWGQWAGLGDVRLAREGQPERNGVGAVRAFQRMPGLREEITAFESPRRMEYRIARGGFPVTDHRGAVELTSEGDRTRVRWEATFRSRIPLTGGLMARVVGLLFSRILLALERDLDRNREKSF